MPKEIPRPRRGLSSRPTIGRLSYLNRQSKPAPTRNYGSEDARARTIRRRVARITTRSLDQFGNPVNFWIWTPIWFKKRNW